MVASRVGVGAGGAVRARQTRDTNHCHAIRKLGALFVSADLLAPALLALNAMHFNVAWFNWEVTGKMCMTILT